MKHDKKTIEGVALNAILQINPKAELGQGDGQLCVVMRKETWGVSARLASGHVISVAWQHLEPTGGMAVWGADGERVMPEVVAPTHHP